MEDAGSSWLGLALFSWFGYSHWSLIHQWSKFQISILILKVQTTSMSCKSSYWSFGGRWMFLTGVYHLDLDLDMVIGLWYTHDPNFGSLSWFWRCKEHPWPLSPGLGLWRMLEDPDWGLGSWSLFGYGHWSLGHLCSKFWLSILILKVRRTSMSIKFWFVDFDEAGGSWLGFWILIRIWIWSLVFHTYMFWILALYLDLKVQRTSMSYKSLLGLWGRRDVPDRGLAPWS